MEIKESSFSQINATEYTNWVYIDLSERKAMTVEIGEEHKSEIPAEWDLAIHRYDIKTNEGAAFQTTYTSIDDLKASGKLPAEENFVKDEWTTDKIAIDMSGMMEGNIKYTEDYRNDILSGWLNVDTSSMPPIYTMSNQVYLIRLKDNTYAAIRFTNYTNARGIKDISTLTSCIRLISKKTTKQPITKNETYIYSIHLDFLLYSNLFHIRTTID